MLREKEVLLETKACLPPTSQLLVGEEPQCPKPLLKATLHLGSYVSLTSEGKVSPKGCSDPTRENIPNRMPTCGTASWDLTLRWLSILLKMVVLVLWYFGTTSLGTWFHHHCYTILWWRRPGSYLLGYLFSTVVRKKKKKRNHGSNSSNPARCVYVLNARTINVAIFECERSC